ncbi:MAG: protease pro-enzyme activation domain-containing protein, partial [Terracidiphilus sp.]
MLHFNSRFLRQISSFRILPCLLLAVLAGVLAAQPALAQGPEAETRPATPPRLLSPIDEHALVTLKGNVRADLTPARDLGAVEDGMPLRLFLVLRRSNAQQADLDNLLARQQQPTAAEYHKWLTPKAFGTRFGLSPVDIAKLSDWLESHGLRVRSVLNNASVIDFEATAGQVRDTFHTEMHYFNVQGGKYPANVKDPQIPAALVPVIAGIHGLSQIPLVANHTAPRHAAYDEQNHRWLDLQSTADTVRPAFNAGSGYYLVTPQDFYTIYDVNPVFTGGNLAANATVAVIEQSDIVYGTVNATTNVATGGDVATFRSVFGVPGTLNMLVYHGYGSVTCNDPGIAADEFEATLDAEWINATAPSAKLIFMSCDSGIFTSLAAVVDNNMADVMSISYGGSELNFNSSDYSYTDAFWEQAAAQGQSVFISSGDSGSDVADQNTTGLATSGINVSALNSPLVTSTGGTDFSDQYDAYDGGPAQSNYWKSSNSSYYGDAIGYVPETAWNNSCVSSILAQAEGDTGVGYCNAQGVSGADGTVVGGSGGFSTHYTTPAYQLGISGYSGAYHSIPDVAGFAANGFWGHYLIVCDSTDSDPCTSSGNFGGGGGTSFVAPYMAGVGGLLVNSAGSRQGLLNPNLYALGKAQYSEAATANACYSNGQTNNTGVTTGVPAASCIFNDVTTSNNDMPCSTGSTDCYSGTSSVGALSLNGTSSLAIAYPSAPGFDQVTGIGTVNVSNLITKWSTGAFTSATGISATATSITTSQSTKLTATVTSGNPEGYSGSPIALTGSVNFAAGTTALGSCTVSAGTCSLTVAGTALAIGSNSVTATFVGSPTYPTSSSSVLTVTVSTSETPTITSVSAILPQQTQTITINGSGFGTHVSYTGDLGDILFADSSGTPWYAGYTGDAVTLAVTSWTDTQIVLSGFSGSFGTDARCIKP